MWLGPQKNAVTSSVSSVHPNAQNACGCVQPCVWSVS